MMFIGFSVCSLSMDDLIRLPAGSRSHSHSYPGIGGGWPLPGSDPARLGYPQLGTVARQIALDGIQIVVPQALAATGVPQAAITRLLHRLSRPARVCMAAARTPAPLWRRVRQPHQIAQHQQAGIRIGKVRPPWLQGVGHPDGVGAPPRPDEIGGDQVRRRAAMLAHRV